MSFDVADADAAVAHQGEQDVVLAFNLLRLVTDPDRVLELATRALQPGGVLISTTVCTSGMNPLIPYLALPLMRAVGKAPHVLCFDADVLRSAMARQGMDIRVFIVARKPA